MRLFSISELPFLVSKWVEQFCKLCLNGSSSVQRRSKTGWRDTAFIFFKSSATKVGWHRRNQIAQLTFQDQNKKPKGKKPQANSHNELNERNKEGEASRTVTSNREGQIARVTTPTPTCVSTPALQNSGITVAGSAMGFLEGKIQTNKQTKSRISVPSAKQNKKKYTAEIKCCTPKPPLSG